MMYSILSPAETYAMRDKLTPLTRTTGIMRRWLTERKAIKLAVIAEEGNRIIGWACVGTNHHDEQELIGAVFVDRQSRGKGFGHKLIDTLGAGIAASKLRNVPVVYAYDADKIYKNMSNHIADVRSVAYLSF